LTTLYLASAKNIDSWQAKKEDLQRAFPLDVPMVPSPSIAVAADDDHLMCGGFFLGETITFGSLEFIADHLSG
jgi:hypothetical protein